MTTNRKIEIMCSTAHNTKRKTQTGIPAIDHAHPPLARFRNDDVQNGMALCKIQQNRSLQAAILRTLSIGQTSPTVKVCPFDNAHHWLFDKGLISVDQHYRALVSKAIEKEEPERLVSQFRGREIHLPESAERFPSQVALEWHRGEVFG